MECLGWLVAIEMLALRGERKWDGMRWDGTGWVEARVFSCQC